MTTATIDRAERLLGALRDAGSGADAMLVTDLTNVRWLTGFTGSNAAAIVGPDVRALLTDFRYREQAAAEVDPTFSTRIVSGNLLGDVGAVLGAAGPALGFEDDHLTVRGHAELREALSARVELVAAGDPVLGLRAVKDDAELERIRAAAQLADAALREVMEHGLVGRTEAQVALELDDAMRRAGASGPSFDTIVAAGPHGALPHATPREVAIESGTLVVVDWGAVLDGYCSDCTRTLATGDISDADHVVYDLVHRAQVTGLHALAPGASGRAVDGAARAVIDDGGHGAEFGHSLGHGVGLQVHEAPRLSQRFDDELAVGNVVTVEPGVYVAGEIGVRIEDLCVVADGGPEILTHIPKELITVS